MSFQAKQACAPSSVPQAKCRQDHPPLHLLQPERANGVAVSRYKGTYLPENPARALLVQC